MTRFARLGAAVVLVALSICAQASAAPVPSHVGDIARLEPTRMFNPDSESLFAALTAEPRFMSPIEVGVFNIAVTPGEELSLRDSEPAFAPHGTGVASINLAIPQLRASYAPIAPVQLTAPRLTTAPLAVPSNRAKAPDTALAVRTTVPSTLTSPQVQQVHFGAYIPYTPSLRGIAANVAVPGRVGKMHFETAFHAMQVCGTADEGAACDAISGTANDAIASSQSPISAAQSLGAGTAFNVRAGNSAVKVGLSSSVEHASSATAGMFPYVPLDPNAQTGLSYFGLSDVDAQTVGAALAVPVNRHITVGLQYDRARYQGDYNNPLVPGLDASKDTYLGNITYQLPNTNSAITLSARQYRYQDTFSPNYNLTQTQADLNFTVKF